MSDLSWVDGSTVSAKLSTFKAFVKAREAFETEARTKLNAKAFSYKQGKVGIGCEAKPVAKVNGKAIDPKAMAQLMALAKQLGISA